MPRIIVHLDADAFFASVEQAADSRLRGKPVAVGGEKRGIIASASYEARRFGIYTPMPTARAHKLCPKLIVLPGDFEKYERFSHWMFSYAYDFTPDVEITGIDEGYFDLTSVRKPCLDVARTIRRAIGQGLKISVSEGIGTNKLVSQIASKLHKPAAFEQVSPGHEISFLHPLPNRWLPGVGPSTASRLDAAGLAQIKHIAATPLELLNLLFGKLGSSLKQFANGIDDRPIIPAAIPAKTFSQQETFAADITDSGYAEAVLRRMADHLMTKVRAEGRSIRTLTVKVRYNDMAEDQCSMSLNEPTDLESDFYGRLPLMLREAWKRRVSLRLVSLKLSNVYDGLFRAELPLERRAAQHAARQRLARVVDELRHARGHEVLLRGHDFRLRDAPVDAVEAPSNLGRAQRSAELHSAVPQNCILPISGKTGDLSGCGQSAECNSAIQQIANLRYVRQEFPCPVAFPQHVDTSVPKPKPISYRRALASTRRPSAQPYVPLQVHSYYSFLNSTLSIRAIIDWAKSHELPAIALTDQGNLHGAVAFTQAARLAGIKPIIGAELRIEGQTLLLYVESARGYSNLCRLLSRNAPRKVNAAENADPADSSVAEQQRRSYKLHEFDGLTDGLIAASADVRVAELFPGRYYRSVPVTNSEGTARGPVEAHDRPDALFGRQVASHFPAVACPPVHYAMPSDRQRFDILQAIRTRTLLRQEHPDKLAGGQYHFRPSAEMRSMFDVDQGLLEHTLEIADRCNFQIAFGKPQFPAFLPAGGLTPPEFLKQLVLEGLHDRYGARWTEFQRQVEQELAIITEVGYEEYFLVVWDLLQECRRRGIEWITRGSAADSLVCYCLRISDVCPIRFDLYFRRFLNKERMALNKLPDIDVDFPHDRKDDVVDLIFEKYGAGHCAVVGGFSTFQARSAFAEVAKVLGVAEREVRKFTEHFPWSFGGGWVPDEPTPSGGARLVEMLNDCPESRDLPLNEEPYKTAMHMAQFLDGFPRYPKMHPCGVVLSRQPMLELTPTFVSNKGYATTHLDMDCVEAIGLVKMDILAQGGLAAMRDARRSLADRGIEVNLRGLEPWNDPAVWEMIASGGARAVHHIESPAMVGLCRQCNVREIDGLIAIVSVIRPGAANEGKKQAFTRRYQGLEPVVYPHPSLEPCLRSTFGLVVYEEHILQLCEAFAGLPAGRADVLRRALNKQKREVIAQIKIEFFAAARARGHGEEKIAEVWELASGFAGYAFCKAHSTAYGVEAYQAAWLKRYYPVEFMAAVLTNGKGFYHPIVYVLECHRLGIRLLPPSVNQPGPEFNVVAAGGTEGTQNPALAQSEASGGASVPASRRVLPNVRLAGTLAPPGQFRGSLPPPNDATPENSAPGNLNPAHTFAIRVPLVRIKGLGEKTRTAILDEHRRGPFESLRDFFRRVVPQPEEMEAMIRVGAFDEFGQRRTAQFWDAQFLQKSYCDGATRSQGWLLPPLGAERLPTIPLHEPTRRERMQWEADLFDFAVSGHPLELHDDVAWETYCPVSRIGEHVGDEIVTCGLVIEQRVHHQITGEPMKFLTLADWTGMVETELFAATYRSYGLATVRYPVLEITATVEPFENARGFSLRVHRAGKPRTKMKNAE